VWAEEDNEMKTLLNICLLLCLSMAIAAQQTAKVTGQAVVSFPGHRGVNRSGVTLESIHSPDVKFSVSADADGNFVFENVPPGEYLITADGGYSAISMFGEKRITVVAGENTAVEVVVGPSPRIREFVTVSADEQQTLRKSLRRSILFPAQEMRDRADITLIDALRTIPGFRVQQLGGFGRTASIKSRGLRNQDTAVLLDGIRFRDPGSITGDATPFLSDITLTSVSRVEVLRGSGSSLYGTNAVGGTIDFQTPVAQEGFHGQISGALGGLGLGRLRTNLSYGNSKFAINGAFSRTAYTEGIDGNDNASNNNFQSRIEVRPTESTRVSAEILYLGREGSA
jgi:iron complex outermembrane receptor protein